MNIFSDFTDKVQNAISMAGLVGKDGEPLDLSLVTVEPPRDASHGDLATNAAMVLAKSVGCPPREIAMKIVAILARLDEVESAEVAGPGFINIRLQPHIWADIIAAVNQQGEAFGYSDLGQNERVNIEYVSANPTGPMHVGHCRGAVVGDALANLMQVAGYDVTREYYINDAGAQVDILAHSAFLRYREALGEAIGDIPEGLYPGDYLKQVGVDLAEEFGSSLTKSLEDQWLPLVRERAIAAMMEMIRDDLARLNVVHDVFFSERSLKHNKDRVAEAIDNLAERGLIYEGVLPPPKGQVSDDWEDREQLLFRSTQFGDDIDRALKKSDGSYTYFAGDIAYHFDKYQRGFTNMIDVWGADHAGYCKRMQSAVEAFSGEIAHLDIKICQLVRLFRADEPVKMSKRSGNLVTLREVVDEVGGDVVRFMMLYRRNDAPLDFDFQKVTEQSKDNPVFYVQYGHARCCSIFRMAQAELSDFHLEAEIEQAKGEYLTDRGEIAIIRKLAGWPRLIESAAQTQEVHRVAFYLYELASEFHAQWNRGKEETSLRFIKPNDRELTKARLALVNAVRLVLASGLSILGVMAPDEMR